MILGSIILAGGQSARMGRDKADLPWGDGSLLLHVVETLINCSFPVVVVARDAAQKLPPLHTESDVIFDPRPGEGPLQAIAAGMDFVKGKCDAVLVAGCDLPFLDQFVVGRLFDRLGDHSGVVPSVGGRPQPLCAIYHLRVREEVGRLIDAGERRAQALAEIRGVQLLAEDVLRTVDPTMRFFRDVDTQADYEQAKRDAGL
ncbi:MAG: molybdenum cofactor guanylyltransferase [Planctomycetota bacterium]